MRAAYDALPADMKLRLRALVAEHAIMYSRKKLGFTDFSDEENQTLPPVPQALVRKHAGSGRIGLYLASHAGRMAGTHRQRSFVQLDVCLEQFGMAKVNSQCIGSAAQIAERRRRLDLGDDCGASAVSE